MIEPAIAAGKLTIRNSRVTASNIKKRNFIFHPISNFSVRPNLMQYLRQSR